MPKTVTLYLTAERTQVWRGIESVVVSTTNGTLKAEFCRQGRWVQVYPGNHSLVVEDA